LKIANGIDLIEIRRVSEVIARHQVRFLSRVFTEAEIQDTKANTASLAARFAAKEAVAKALGCGIGPIAWREIEVRKGPENMPVLHLYGSAARLAQEKGLTEWSISLSHTETHAIAVAVAVGA
jgi:holo-[acyl-carrier protein] synthase